MGHALDATAAKDAIWEVDDDLDGAVNWKEFRAAAARVAWGGGGGGGGGGNHENAPSPSPSPPPSPSSPPRHAGASSAILQNAASDAHPRTLVDIGLFLARADGRTGKLPLSALERAAHLSAGRGGVPSALAGAAEVSAAAARGPAATAAAAAAAATSLSLGEYLEARQRAQAKALRAPPPYLPASLPQPPRSAAAGGAKLLARPRGTPSPKIAASRR